MHIFNFSLTLIIGIFPQLKYVPYGIRVFSGQTMKRKGTALVFILVVVLLLCGGLWARPTTADEAGMVVAGWLMVNARPLGMALGHSVIGVETFTDVYGNPVYYIVYLERGDFVVVSADDLVEPIIAFADEGVFEPSSENPLGALVTRDIKGRIASIRNTIALQMESVIGAQGKWRHFINAAESIENGFSLMGANSISNVRVEPFVKSKWGQTTTCGRVSFNYYTPSKYPCGCTATAMAQLMRYHEYPNGRASVGSKRFEIKVDDIYPVILGIIKDDSEAGHAVVADGYGYDFSTLYHHLNMGWNGSDDIWYNLPEIDYSASDYYNVINGCIYNMYTYGTGEIISGRITDLSREPVGGATVIARGWGGPYTAETNEKGIYALVKVGADSTYTLTVIKPGYDFATREVTTGKSGHIQNVSGNRWGVDFVGGDAAAGVTSDYSREDFETADFSKFPWINSGDGNWDITFLERYAGTYGAETGKINDNESTALRVSVECTSGDITFYRKVSSEPACDYLKFYIDGVEMVRWSGMEDWDAVSFAVTAGTKIFEWTYSKDGSISRGSDRAWIDEIVFPLDYGKLCDFDGSDMVDFVDFSFLAGQWLRRGASGSADLNGDGGVDFLDLNIFAENWLAD